MMEEMAKKEEVDLEYHRIIPILKEKFNKNSVIHEEESMYKRLYILINGNWEISFGQERYESPRNTILIAYRGERQAVMNAGELVDALHDLGMFLEFQRDLDGQVAFLIHNFDYVKNNWSDLHKKYRKYVNSFR